MGQHYHIHTQQSCQVSYSLYSTLYKRLAIFPSPVGISLIKLSLAGKNLIIPRHGRVWFVTSRPGTGKSLAFFTVYYRIVTGGDLEGSLNLLKLLCHVKKYIYTLRLFLCSKTTIISQNEQLKRSPALYCRPGLHFSTLVNKRRQNARCHIKRKKQRVLMIYRGFRLMKRFNAKKMWRLF